MESQKMYKVNKIQKEKQIIHTTVKVISAILYIILIPIIIFNFTLIIKSFINPNEIPDFLGYKTFVIVSGSMEPTIMTQDAILVKEVPQDEIKINDIISFSQGESIITHRVIGIVKDDGMIKYRTKGDNNNIEDKKKTTYEQIEGKYQFKLKQLGVVTKMLKSKITLIILVLIIILIYCYKRKIEMKKQERKEKRKQYKQESVDK